ncbi:hypothetical protein [Fibrella forsythiae]|uniref:Terminase large subunit gp17-like C-terminal domain-containing protein n=1 Tax=Fibrella forsythiae TaxID=2817061 RepID=A0ABS3JBE2_9BACT|nr:hypothetical protein [Fibrella forsythiae]MBO0947301.1 hypothetical protein [Fibrella forsythiae]
MIKLVLSAKMLANMIMAERSRCLKSFFEFVKSFWGVIIKEKPIYNWHIPFICEELQKLTVFIKDRLAKPYDLLINIPPGTTKTSIVTILWPAWLWAIDPTIRVISNSYAGKLSVEHAVKTRDIIYSDLFKQLFPEVRIRRDKAGKASYTNTKGGDRNTTSSGGAITGFHGHVIINDDPLNPKQALSDELRNTANEHTKTLSSRKVDKENTPVVTIMQRLHADDVTGFLLKKKEDNIRHICLPAEDGPNVKPAELRKFYVDGLLDPRRLNRKVLAEAKVDLGSREYAGQFDQTPSVEGGNIVKEEWFKFVSRETFNRMRKTEPIIFFGDTAFTDKQENDPSGLLATCRIGNDLFILDYTTVRLEFPEFLKFLPTYVRAQGYTETSTIRIEPKTAGLPTVQSIKRETKLNITYTPSPNDSKLVRLNAVTPKIEVGRVYLISGVWNEAFVTEVCGFPTQPHDEAVDLISYAIEYHLKGSTTQDNAAKAASMLG